MKSLYLIFFSYLTFAQIPQVSSGTIERLDNFHSKFVDTRYIDIWLPKDYSKEKKYAVLYMHDGQMLFDANTTWNKQAWEIDETATRLVDENKTIPFIVVGIWNNGQKRHPEYFPQKPFENLKTEEKEWVEKQLQEKGRVTDSFLPYADDYLKFIVKELKPFIDKKYATSKGKENTFIAGASMGGLISLYAICEYPNIFGGAACLSTHWPGVFNLENNPIPQAFINYIDKKLPKLIQHKSKIYFDCGNKTLDALYPEIQKKVDSLFTIYPKELYLSKFFENEDHSEEAWSKRIHIPLQFLLSNSN